MNQANVIANTHKLEADQLIPLVPQEITSAIKLSNGANNGPNFLPKLATALAVANLGRRCDSFSSSHDYCCNNASN